jgi:hypothetical protein
MEHGVFDMVMKEMTNARTMGRLSNLSDLEAYKHVGDELDRAGAFAHLVKPNKASTEAKPVTQQERLPASSNTVLPKSQGAQEDESLRNKRRAAGASKTTAGAGGTGANPNFNPLAMSDDEFSKLSANRFR